MRRIMKTFAGVFVTMAIVSFIGMGIWSFVSPIMEMMNDGVTIWSIIGLIPNIFLRLCLTDLVSAIFCITAAGCYRYKDLLKSVKKK